MCWRRERRRSRWQHAAAAIGWRQATPITMDTGGLAAESGRGGPSRNSMSHRAVPVAASRNDVAAMHNLPLRNARLNLRPGRARRLSEAGRHWAPTTRQRATREERHSGRTGPAYCNKARQAPPVIDGIGCTVALGDGRRPPENVQLHLRFFASPTIGRAGGPAGMSRPPSEDSGWSADGPLQVVEPPAGASLPTGVNDPNPPVAPFRPSGRCTWRTAVRGFRR